MFIDHENSIDVLFYDTFERIRIDSDDIQVFQGSLVGIFKEHVYLKGHINLKIFFS